jgi:glycosyltransferase involved in cell wall biosynthesis
MKICMLAPEFPPVWGGVGTYTYELTRHLPKTIEIHIVTPKRESFGMQKMSPGSESTENIGNNVYIHYVSVANDSFMYNAAFQYACLKQVPKIVKEERIDVIHSHQAHMPDLLLMFRKMHANIVTTVHTTIKFQRTATKASHRNINDLENSEKATYYLYPFLRIAEELYVKRNRTYITPSSFMSKWLRNNFSIAANINVIPNCIDLPDANGYGKSDLSIEKIIPKDSFDKKIILYSGRLLAMKGVDDLVDAIPSIINSIGKNELLFVFAGPGNSDNYRQKLNRLGIKTDYLFPGSLPRDILIKLIKKSELTVLPSYNENCPYAILESMVCGTPVVASNVGGIPEIITNEVDGLLVEPGNPDMLAKTIERLLSDESLRDLLGQRAKSKIANKFSWQNNISKYLKCYSEADGNKSQAKVD